MRQILPFFFAALPPFEVILDTRPAAFDLTFEMILDTRPAAFDLLGGLRNAPPPPCGFRLARRSAQLLSLRANGCGQYGIAHPSRQRAPRANASLTLPCAAGLHSAPRCAPALELKQMAPDAFRRVPGRGQKHNINLTHIK